MVLSLEHQTQLATVQFWDGRIIAVPLDQTIFVGEGGFEAAAEFIEVATEACAQLSNSFGGGGGGRGGGDGGDVSDFGNATAPWEGVSQTWTNDSNI
jgi:hypothetical protein